jgi:hypothetical protein
VDSPRNGSPEIGRPRLLERGHEAIRRCYYSRRTEEAYVHWIRRHIFFNGKRHPETLGEAEVTAFLSHLTGRLQRGRSRCAEEPLALWFRSFPR